jgi:hypothetical protein
MDEAIEAFRAQARRYIANELVPHLTNGVGRIYPREACVLSPR